VGEGGGYVGKLALVIRVSSSDIRVNAWTSGLRRPHDSGLLGLSVVLVLDIDVAVCAVTDRVVDVNDS
jgi:hypothetical protein